MLRIFRKTKLSTILALSLGLVTVIVLFGLFSKNTLAGYGPSTRLTYDWNKYDPSLSCTNPANAYGRCGSMNGPVFDSFINSPAYGNEENFAQIAPFSSSANPINASYANSAQAIPGQQYWVRLLVHNDANQNLNCLPIHDSSTLNDCTQVDLGSPSIAINTSARIAIAQGVSNGVQVMGYIDASNATPNEVWDSVLLSNSNQAFSVSYVPGSAYIYNKAFPTGLQLSDNIFSPSGTLIGYNAMNGILPGCFNFAGYIYVRVQVNAPALKIQKLVRNNTSSTWSKAINANKGDNIQWKITYQDTGTLNDYNLTLKDVLPSGLNIVPGSIKWYDQFNNGTVQNDNSLNQGLDLGNYAPSATLLNGEVVFNTVISNNLSTCSISNTGYGWAQNVPMVSSSASVNINNCNTPPTPIYTCNLLGVSNNQLLATINNFQENAQNGAQFDYAIVNWGDGSSTKSSNILNLTHQYSQAGDYSITVNAYFSVNNNVLPAESNNCFTVITISNLTPPPPVTPVYPTPTPTPTTPPAPKKLVNTGPGSFVGIFVGTTILGIGLYNFILRKKLSKNN